MTLRKRVAGGLTAAPLVVACLAGLTSPAQAAPRTSLLTVTVHWAPGLTDTWTLRCDPVGGTHPNRLRACALLDSLPDPFDNKPTGMACTMIVSGPERAHVVGRWQGRSIDTTFDRADGCANTRWLAHRALLTEPGMVTVRGRVDLGPTCPVQRPGENCQTSGTPATVTATSGSRHRTVASGADGFSLRLHRGVWAFTADAGMSCPTVMRDARLGDQPTTVVISCDTGIRTAR